MCIIVTLIYEIRIQFGINWVYNESRGGVLIPQKEECHSYDHLNKSRY